MGLGLRCEFEGFEVSTQGLARVSGMLLGFVGLEGQRVDVEGLGSLGFMRLWVC